VIQERFSKKGSQELQPMEKQDRKLVGKAREAK
jgi:hypothetical protein